MNVTARQRRLLFHISVMLYIVTNIMLIKKYDEQVGEVDILGHALSTEKTWKDFIFTIGLAFIPEFVAQILELLRCASNCLMRVIIGVLRTMVSSLFMFATGGMFIFFVWGMQNCNVPVAVLLVGLCGTMILYSISTWIAAAQNEKRRMERLFDDDFAEA